MQVIKYKLSGYQEHPGWRMDGLGRKFAGCPAAMAKFSIMPAKSHWNQCKSSILRRRSFRATSEGRNMSQGRI